MKKVGIVVTIILLIDQISKIYVKTHFELHESMKVLGLDWFRITFVENPGAAYGFQLGGYTGKIILGILRFFLIIGIIWWIKNNVKEKASNYFIIPMAMILAGAIGNLIDGVFYSMMFDQGTIFFADTNTWDILPQYEGTIAKLNWTGYNKPFLGCVVDMLHFPMFSGSYPQWVPVVGGKHFEFFSYIFNIADSAITLGVIALIVFKQKVFKSER